MNGPAPASEFTVSITGDICTVVFDAAGSPFNAMSGSVMSALDRVLDDLAARTDLRGAIFASGRDRQYNLGADLDELAGADLTPAWARRFAERGQQLLMRMATLPIPTVAAINGAALGGGAEFALALDVRLAAPGRDTRIGFPEPTLGLIPSWGGTQRLPRVVGLDHALALVGSGEMISAERAEEIGLVSRVVPAGELLAEAHSWITQSTASERASTEWRQRREQAGRPLLATSRLSPEEGGRAAQAQPAEDQRAAAAARRAVRDGCSVTLEEGLTVERDALVDLVAGGISKAQIKKAAMARRLAALL